MSRTTLIIDRWKGPRWLARVPVGKRDYRSGSFNSLGEAEAWSTAEAGVAPVRHARMREIHIAPEALHAHKRDEESAMRIPVADLSRALDMHSGSGARLVRKGIVASHCLPGVRSRWYVDSAKVVRVLTGAGVVPRPLLESFGIDPRPLLDVRSDELPPLAGDIQQ